jgi:hypothetical protein
MSETRRRSSDRFKRRNQIVTAKKRPRQFLLTPLGNILAGEFMEHLAKFLAGEMVDQPDPPPKFLRELVRELNDPLFLALAALASLLDAIFRGWDPDDRSPGTKLKLKIGEDLYWWLRQKVKIPKRWSEADRVRAGDWLLAQALHMDMFGWDGELPCISDEWLPRVGELREYLIRKNPSYAPLLKPSAPWTGWSKTCDGFEATFVRDWRPQTEAAINDAFLDPDWDHARGVNALGRVPLKIDAEMVALVERFAVELMGNAGAKRKADETKVKADVADAKYCGDSAFWNDYSCDRRGRIYALQNLNFAREDHVRSLFRFANGMKLNGDTTWLEIHCANAEGSTDKKSRDERRKWVVQHREDILAIAADPIGTFDKWKDADSPFCFVAACRELAAAWSDPNFVTHLPIGFDGSANGLQHLALLSSDFNAAGMVNLWSDELLLSDDTPSDVYATLIKRAIELIEADDCDHAGWWREQFGALDDKQKRKLLKRPIMTFAYSVTPEGATLQIAEVYKSLPECRST